MSRIVIRKPKWIRTTWQQTEEARNVRRHLREHKLHTVCEESNCPNRGECYNRGTCTMLIMGPICTRNCTFCSVTHGRPDALDPAEPRRVAESIVKLGVQFVVITSVDRDDLADFGAEHYANTIHAIREQNPDVKVEVLTPDFQMNEKSLQTVLAAQPNVFAHNVETVRRLTSPIRDPRASYDRSLAVLKYAHKYSPAIPVKSGLMVGVGETDEEILECMSDIRDSGAVSITIGQYLSPTKKHIQVKRYVEPEVFRMYEDAARNMGYVHVASGPMVRSSYHAEEIFND
jgi:lipoyl synthase